MEERIALIDSIISKYTFENDKYTLNNTQELRSEDLGILTDAKHSTNLVKEKQDVDVVHEISDSSEDTIIYSNMPEEILIEDDLIDVKPPEHNVENEQPIPKKRSKSDKQLEKESNKVIKEKEKIIKNTLKTINTNKEPGRCFKLVTVILDQNFKDEKFFGAIQEQLSTVDINYCLEIQSIPLSISWKRTTESLSMNSENKPLIIQNTETVPEIFLLIKWNKVVELVQDKRLQEYIENFKELCDKTIFLCLFGLENYFKFQKNPNKKYDRIYGKAPKISRTDLEIALTKLQLFYSYSYRFVENDNDLALLIMQFTKSIAELPYKLEKSKNNEQVEWHMSSENKDCIRVDKDGNGLSRLWSQQLSCFSNVSLETAEAIVLNYKTPKLLMDKYKDISNSEGRELLRDIQIRRNISSTSSSRKIGPELSKKVHLYFTSVDGNDIL